MKRILVSAAAALMTWPALAADLTQPIEQMIAGYIQPEARVFADVASRLPRLSKRSARNRRMRQRLISGLCSQMLLASLPASIFCGLAP